MSRRNADGSSVFPRRRLTQGTPADGKLRVLGLIAWKIGVVLAWIVVTWIAERIGGNAFFQFFHI